MYFLLKMGIFHGYVSLPKDKICQDSSWFFCSFCQVEQKRQKNRDSQVKIEIIFNKVGSAKKNKDLNKNTTPASVLFAKSLGVL